ncbi:site-specific integrase [Bifidobacterium amazonense]|uniref:Site-specific integrase n=1 Tax=Bifidobacterium amazonense TaxID=2809027 RepID=A0ABS9VS27_9BIFI|nr:site-specific integrase [Bifidobacterium amazonense]MCH9274882.1 site-specific integrase [Bifidobacterium amazonense]
MRKKQQRRGFGSIIERTNEAGYVTSLIVRYQNPLDRSKRITKSFKAGQRALAESWLDAEKDYLDRCERGLDTWISPADRERAKEAALVLFGDYVERWIEGYRKVDGGELSGSSKRNLRADCSHFLPAFASMPVQEITPEDIRRWYDRPHPEGRHAFRRACQRFKAIMKTASTEGMDGSAPLRADNPFIFPIPTVPESDRVRLRPLSREELKALYDAMPDYTRLSVYLSALAGGLRIGEVCALQRRDIDLDHLILHVRHSVNRGPEDRGELVLSRTKTASSVRDVVIPVELVPLIREHLDAYCDPGPTAMVFKAKRARMLGQNVLRKQFDIAKKAAGRPDIVFHTLRATHATLLILAGGTLREAMNQLGHTSTDVAIRHYQRAVDQHTKQVANELAVEMMPVARTREVVEGELLQAQDDLKTARERVRRLKAELILMG